MNTDGIRPLSEISMQRGITQGKRPPRYNPEFIFPGPDSPYYPVLKYRGERNRVGEMMIGGPAGTGKTHIGVMYGYKLACNYPGSVGVFVRKVKESIKRTIVPTFQEVLGYDPMERREENFVLGFGGIHPQKYVCRNGSEIYMLGLADPKQFDSLQVDWMFINQAEETDEEEWQILTARTRGRRMPFRVVYGDCNPVEPEHYLCPYDDNENRRDGVYYIPTKHEDNPILVDPITKERTSFGHEYIGTLDRMTGLNYDRYRLGLWKSPEGAIFHIEKCHIINQLPWDRESEDPHYEPLEAFTIYRCMDFGMHPSPNVCLWVAENNNTGDTIVFKEWRRTRKDTIEMAKAVLILDVSEIESTTIDNDENIQSILRKNGIYAVRAKKGDGSVHAGLDLIQEKLDRTKRGEKGGLYFYSNLEAGRDAFLEENKRPTNTIMELKLITWDLDSIKPKPAGERHGIDALRYHLLWQNERILDFPLKLTKIPNQQNKHGFF